MKEFIILLRRFLPPYKGYFFLNILFTIFSTIAGLFSFAMIIPVLQILFGISEPVHQAIPFSQLNDVGLGEFAKSNFYFFVTSVIESYGKSTALLFIGLFLVLMTLLKTGFDYLSLHVIVPLRSGITRDIRQKIYHKVNSLPIGYFNDERKGDIMTRMTSDVNAVETSIIASIEMMLKNPIIILINLSVMIYLSWELTLFVLILLPLSGTLIGRIGKSLKKTSNKGQVQLGILLSHIDETLTGMRIIKAFNAEGLMNAKFDKYNNKYRSISNHLARKRNLAHPVSEFLGTLVIVLVLWYGGRLILNEGTGGGLTAETFIYYIVVFYSIINPSKAFTTALYNVEKGLASMNRIDEVLDVKNPIVNKSGAPIPSSFKSEIEFSDVSFKYEKEWVLKNINIKISKGKTVALVGQSGSGKSTLVDLIPRFYDIQKGTIKIDGADIRDLDIKGVRSLMGNVNQSPILFNDTFANNISFGIPNASLDDIIAAAKVANAHDFIMATEEGYNTNIGEGGGKLSGGQRQRVSIARAILANPPILILDEATSALDTESEKLVQEALENLMRNRTTIVIAHRLSTIRNADEICVMFEGEIIERGKHEALLDNNGYYRKLHEMQMF